LSGMRAQEILKPLLLRRTKDGELDGKPLLELEPKYVDVVKLDFSLEERQVGHSLGTLCYSLHFLTARPSSCTISWRNVRLSLLTGSFEWELL
jgi:hypothetical protein